MYDVFRGPFLLIWINYNPNVFNNYIHHNVWAEVLIHSQSTFMTHFTKHMITIHAGIKVKSY